MSALTSILAAELIKIEETAAMDRELQKQRLTHHLMPPTGWLNDPTQLRKRDRLLTFPQRLLRRISFLSCPILIERKRENKKEAGASPSAQTEGGTPALL